MMPHYSKIHNSFILEGKHYEREELKEIAYSFIKEGQPFEKEIGLFLLDWLDNSGFIWVQTSGTTGKSKKIKLNKQAMVKSAIATGIFFNLQPGNLALHCLSTKYIAGKMMLVRALVLGLELELVSPKGNPLLKKTKKYDFVAMVPMQVEKAMEQIHIIKTLLIGGIKPSQKTISKLQKKQIDAYETYGMTETITHIAAKRIDETYFKALPNVTFSLDSRNCLQIEVPKILDEIIITNDMVELVNKQLFRWLGRIDNVINSGGVKLFPEQIEEKLQNKMQQRFFIASEPHDNLGEQVILIVETDNQIDYDDIFTTLNTYEKPKKTYMVSQFKETPTGKIQRSTILKEIGVR